MTTPTECPRLVVGLVQLPNSDNISLNAERMLAAAQRWAGLGAEVVLFPECALTGFTSKVGACEPEALEGTLERLQQRAEGLDVALVVPSVVRMAPDRHLNGGWVLLPAQERTFFVKTGLTPSEKGFFSAESEQNQRVFVHRGVRLGLVICREVADGPEAHFAADDVDVVLWPGYWRWDADDGPWEAQASAGGLGQAAFECVQRWGKPLLQANFCHNELHSAGKTGPSGASVVIDAQNKMVCAGPGPEEPAGGVLVELERGNGGRWDVRSAKQVVS